MKPLEIRNYKPLGDIVFEYLRTAILNGDLKPGERLMEMHLAQKLGVSRTPVREAIRKLEKEKFVEMAPRKGAYVAGLTAKDILDVLEIRMIMEGFASGLAACRMLPSELEELKKILASFGEFLESGDRRGMMEMDNAFHAKIFEATGNAKLIDIIRDLHDQFQRFRLIYFHEFDNFHDIQKSHHEIYEAIELGDEKLAFSRGKSHIKDIQKSVEAWTKKREKESRGSS